LLIQIFTAHGKRIKNKNICRDIEKKKKRKKAPRLSALLLSDTIRRAAGG
jgi:hypothetical protein